MSARVLVADDARTVRSYLRRLLVAEGFEVIEAANGYEAYERAVLEPFDLFVVDVNMPQLDGYSLVSRLRASQSTAGCPVVMVSSESAPADAARAYAAGANHYLVKPVRGEDFTRTVRTLTGTVDRADGSGRVS